MRWNGTVSLAGESLGTLPEQKTMIMKHMIPVIMSEMEVQDIDSPEDWRLAEVKYKLCKLEGV